MRIPLLFLQLFVAWIARDPAAGTLFIVITVVWNRAIDCHSNQFDVGSFPTIGPSYYATIVAGVLFGIGKKIGFLTLTSGWVDLTFRLVDHVKSVIGIKVYTIINN